MSKSQERTKTVRSGTTTRATNWWNKLCLGCKCSVQGAPLEKLKRHFGPSQAGTSRLKRVFSLRLFLGLVMSWLCTFLLVTTSPRRIDAHSSRARADADFLHRDFFSQRALFAVPLSLGTLSHFHHTLLNSRPQVRKKKKNKCSVQGAPPEKFIRVLGAG